VIQLEFDLAHLVLLAICIAHYVHVHGCHCVESRRGERIAGGEYVAQMIEIEHNGLRLRVVGDLKLERPFRSKIPSRLGKIERRRNFPVLVRDAIPTLTVHAGVGDPRRHRWFAADGRFWIHFGEPLLFIEVDGKREELSVADCEYQHQI